MAIERRSNGLLLLFMLAVFSLLGWMFLNATSGTVLVRNSAHALSRHAEAEQVRADFATRLKTKQNVEFWYSPSRGTVLALFLVVDNQWAGLVHRITENNGEGWIGDTVCTGEEEPYECTAFIHDRSYWDRVIRRDRYVPLNTYPDIAGMYLRWVAGQY